MLNWYLPFFTLFLGGIMLLATNSSCMTLWIYSLSNPLSKLKPRGLYLPVFLIVTIASLESCLGPRATLWASITCVSLNNSGDHFWFLLYSNKWSHHIYRISTKPKNLVKTILMAFNQFNEDLSFDRKKFLIVKNSNWTINPSEKFYFFEDIFLYYFQHFSRKKGNSTFLTTFINWRED